MATTITTWTSLLNPYLGIFTQPGRVIFVRLTTGWILCTVKRTVTGMLPFADPLGEQAHDAYHRFFPDARWCMDQLWKSLAHILVVMFYRTGPILLALDDTLFHHCGQKISGAGWWRDAVRSTKNKHVSAWGLNLVILTLQIQPPWGGEPLGLPINMRLHHKGGATLIELAQQMINEVKQWFPERPFQVVGDGFFASLAGKELAETTILSRIQCNAEIYDFPKKVNSKRRGRGRPRTKGQRLASPEKMAPRVKKWRPVEVRERGQIRTRLVTTKIILWYRVSHQPILLVISRDPEGKEKDDFLFTTDVKMNPATVIGIYADRWAIEDTFKNTKQLMGGQEPQTFKGQGPERAAGLSLGLYSMVWLWYLLQNKEQTHFHGVAVEPNQSHAQLCRRTERLAS